MFKQCLQIQHEKIPVHEGKFKPILKNPTTREHTTIKNQPVVKVLLARIVLIQPLDSLAIKADQRIENILKTICRDAQTGLMRQMGKSKVINSSKEVVEYSENLVQIDYSDWLLPTTEERRVLKNIFD